MEKKIIFLDIDGTLMDFDGQLPESAKMALCQAKAEGHRLVLCTGPVSYTHLDVYKRQGLYSRNDDGAGSSPYVR